MNKKFLSAILFGRPARAPAGPAGRKPACQNG